MKFKDKFLRLSFWNKAAFVGVVASLISLAIGFWPIFQKDYGPEIVSLLKRGIGQLTGADSFAYVSPQPHDNRGYVPLAIRSVGPNPLTGVRLTIRDISRGVPIVQDAKPVEVGALPRDTILPLEGVYLIPLLEPGVRIYAIDIVALSGVFRQTLQLKTSIVNGTLCLADRIIVDRGRAFSDRGEPPEKALLAQGWHYYVPCDSK